MIIGAMKSGTSSLYKILEAHPKVTFSKDKEPHFFSKTDNWKKKLHDYHQLFEEKDGQIYGEGSTSYTFSPHFNEKIWDDIHEYNPNMKFIYIIREPISRTVSHYVHIYERSYIDIPFKDALKRVPLLTDINNYYQQIQPYIERFGRHQVLLLEFKDFISNQSKVMEDVAKFLNLDFNLFDFNKEYKVNSATNTQRTNFKVHKILNKIRFLGVLFPKSLNIWLWKILSKIKSRKIEAKPEADETDKKFIKESCKADILKISDLMNKDLSDWIKA